MGTGSAAACAHGARHTRRFDSNGDGRVSYIELYKVLSRERTAVGAAARRPLWEEDEVVRAAVDSLCAELYGRREYVYSEWFVPLGATADTIEGQMVAVRDAEYKLMVQDFPEEDVYQEYLFDMTISDVDGLNLLDGALSDAERAAYDRLKAQLDVYQDME